MLVFVQRSLLVLLLLCAGGTAVAANTAVPSASVEACFHDEHCQTESMDCFAHCAAAMSCCAAVLPASHVVAMDVVVQFVTIPFIAKVLPTHAHILLPPPKRTVALL